MKNKLSIKLKNIPKDYWQTIGFVVIAASAYIARAHQYILYPQLFAEDGTVWLAEGYSIGFKSVLIPYNGFFHTTERLFGILVAQLPLQLAPVIFNSTALLMFCWLIYYLFSSRTEILTLTYEKIFMLLAICLIANVDEFFFNFSNSIFLLGIIGALILIAKKPQNRLVSILEKSIFAISCLTLPFALFYLPIVVIERFRYHKKAPFFLIATVIGSVIQLAAYFLSHTQRSSVTFLSLFSKYTLIEINNQIIVPAVRFARIDTISSPNHITGIMISLSVLVCLIATILVMKNCNNRVRFFLLFLALFTAASLKSPLIGQGFSATETLKVMSTTYWGDRYFIYGILALTIILIKFTYLFIQPRARYPFLVIFMSFGLVTSFQYHSFFIDRRLVDISFKYHEGVQQLQTHRLQIVTIPINPEGWYMTLSKASK